MQAKDQMDGNTSGHCDKGKMKGEESRIRIDRQGSRKGPMHPLRFSDHGEPVLCAR